MKAAESKSSTTSQTLQSKNEEQHTPFFDKEGASGLLSNSQQPFFSKNGGSNKPFFGITGIQTKLTIGQPGDKYEKEADSMADQVVQRLAENNDSKDQPVQKKSASIQRKPIFESEAEPNIQAKTISGQSLNSTMIQPKCADCEEEEKLQKKEESGKEEQLQMKPIFESAPPPPDEEMVQRKCAACEAKKEKLQTKSEGPDAPVASSNLESRLQSSKGGGSSLPEETRSQMEGAFGSDFSGVQVHMDSAAVQMNKDLGAEAFTHGSDVYFNAGKYDTGSTEGQRLLGHELTHVVQQGEGVLQKPTGNQVQAQLEVNSQHLFEDEVESTVPISSADEQAAERGASSITPEQTSAAGEPTTSETESSLEEADEDGGKSESTNTTDTNASASSTGDTNFSTSSPTETSTSDGSVAGPEPPASDVSPGASDTVAPGSQGNGTVPSEGQASPSDSCTPECYRGAREEPAEEPAETPSDPPSTQVEAEASEGDEEDLPEIDDCPTEQADAAVAASSTSNPSEAAGPGTASPTGSDSSTGSASAEAAGGSTGAASATSEGASEGPGSLAGDASLAGFITSAESERSIAVSAYEGSSTALGAIPARTESIRAGVQFFARSGESLARQEQRRLAASRANRFLSAIADKLDEATTFALEDIPNQLGLTAESAKAQIGASMEVQKAAISARIEQARGQAIAGAATTQGAVRAQAAAYVADVESQTATAIESLTTTHGETMAQVDALETSTLDNINSIYSDGRTNLEILGTTMGAECTAKGEEFATTYEGFSNCTSNEDAWYDGDLSGRKAEAQAEAAREVAKTYHDRMVEAARKRAREVTRNGRKADRCSIIASAGRSLDTLDEQLPSLINAFETTRDTAIQQAGATESNLIASIDSSLAATIRQLDQQEHSQRQAINDTGYLQQVLQEQIAHNATAAVQQGVQTAVSSVQEAMLDVQARFVSGDTPNSVALENALTQVERNISAAMDGLYTSASTGTTVAQAQLTEAFLQAITSLEGITQSNDESVAGLSGGFSNAMKSISGIDNFATQRTTFTAQVQQSVEASVAALTQALEGFQQSCETTLEGAQTTLTQAQESLEQNLRESKQGLECEMTRKADEAASKEAPAWKRVLAVVLVIIVIIIVIAVTVITAGAAGPLIVAALGGPLLAGAIIGAAVGAVVSGLLAMASNLWSNQDVMKGVGKAILIGAITGAAGGFIGAAAGASAGALFSGASKAVQTAAQFGAAMISAGGFDVVTQYVMGGFSFKDFSLGQLGVTLLITAITFGLAHRVSSRAGAPATDAPEGAPATDAPEGAPVTDTPEGAPATDAPEGAPATDAPEGAPVTDTPEGAPATDAPEGAPATDAPEGAPVTDTPEGVPATDAPEGAPATDTPEGAPATDTPEGAPATDTPEGVPATDTPEGARAREERLQRLSQDPDHNGNITEGSRREAEVALALEEAGRLDGVRRPGHGESGDFVDATGQEWDVKAPRSREVLREHIREQARQAGRPEPNIPETRPLRGEFTVEGELGVIRGELATGERVIIDTHGLTPADNAALRQAVQDAGLGRDVIFYP